MRYLDTCICVEFLRGRLAEGYRLMRECGPNGFALPAIVVAELYFGAEHSQNPERQIPIVESFASSFTVVSFDAKAARMYAKIRQDLGNAGELIGNRDLMIAACAIANNATLVTNNLREFTRVDGLRIESWAEETL